MVQGEGYSKVLHEQRNRSHRDETERFELSYGRALQGLIGTPIFRPR